MPRELSVHRLAPLGHPLYWATMRRIPEQAAAAADQLRDVRILLQTLLEGAEQKRQYVSRLRKEPV